MGKDSPPILAAFASAILTLTGCANDTGNGRESERETPVAQFQSPSDGFATASEIMIPPQSPPRLSASPTANKTPEPLGDEEMAEQFGSLWGPITLSPSPPDSEEDRPSASTAAEDTSDESADHETATPSPEASEASEEDISAAETDQYKNGSHTATGTYMSPASPEAVKVELVLQDDRIASVFIFPLATNETSLKMQKLFAEDVGLDVIGRPLDEIKTLGSINGSSLTTKGFLNALATIREEAAL